MRAGGHALRGPSSRGRRIVEEIGNPASRQVIDFLKRECAECGSYTSARHSNCPPSGRFRKNLLVQETLMKSEERLPHVKVGDTIKGVYGLPVTPATVLDITRLVSYAGLSSHPPTAAEESPTTAASPRRGQGGSGGRWWRRRMFTSGLLHP